MRWMVVICVLALCALPGAAQETPVDPVFAPLSAIPDAPLTRDVTIITDRNAIATAFPRAEKPVDLNALLEVIAGDAAVRDSERLWVSVFLQMMDITSRHIMQMDGGPLAVGVDYMQIGQVATFGIPPDDGMILAGDFDTAAVEAALAERGYEQTGGLWCHQGDCASGMAINFSRRDLTNPFGGEFGRTQPVLVADGLLLSSPNADIAAGGSAALSGELDSLADVDIYRAAAAALSAQGTVLQVALVDGSSLAVSSTNTGLPDKDGIAPIQPYLLYALASIIAEDEQIGAAAFVFADETAAADALAQMVYRLTVLDSDVTRTPWREILAERGLAVSAEVVAAEGLFVGLLRFSGPLATDAEILAELLHDPGDMAQPGAVYQFLYRTLLMRDDQWRWWQ